MRRAIAVLVQCCLLAQVFGCTRTLSIPVNDQLAAVEPGVTGKPGAEISGYVTSDGVSHKFSGTVRLEGEEFVFQHATRKQRGELVGTPEPPFRLPRAEVVSFVHEEVRVGRTVLLSVGVFIAILLIYGAATFEPM